MLVEHSGPRRYLLNALEAAPELFEYSMRDLTRDEADFRPDAERFTIREVVAHLADWDAIYLQRLQRTQAENEPFLKDIDEGRLAIEHEYSKSDWVAQLRLFQQRRAPLVAFLREVSADDWARPCRHERIGTLTTEALALLIPLHDAYHLRQIVQWREAYAQLRTRG